MTYEEIIGQTKAYRCLECGICTGSCPLSRVGCRFSPRLAVERAIVGLGEEVAGESDLWSCLTCRACEGRCPAGVGFTEFMRLMRVESAARESAPVHTHGRVVLDMMEIQGWGLDQSRLDWIDDTLQTATEGEYLYFVGCAPYFDTIFEDLSISLTGAARDTVRLLNHLGIQPIVSNEERCCGHDPFWAGDVETFRELGRRNLDFIRSSGARRVVVSCPECYHMLKAVYPEQLGDLGVEVVHIFDLLVEAVREGRLEFSPTPRIVTYQDPCRLGRFSGVYEQPRELIRALPEVELVEMKETMENAICCGSSGWMNCTAANKAIQVERLRQAGASGAEHLITACPKCRIHLSCALRNDDTDVKIEMQDLLSLLAEALKEG